MRIELLRPGSGWVGGIAARQFALWGPLTGFESSEAYGAFLAGTTRGHGLPKVLVALQDGEPLGSVDLLPAEMTTHPHLTPWMGQLFVSPEGRGTGVGTRLVREAAEHVAQLGHGRLYLYTSGTLPEYYRARGWREIERAHYLGKDRVIMSLDLGPDERLGASR